MSSRKKVLQSLEQKNAVEQQIIGDLYKPILKTAKRCDAENLIYVHAKDNINRDTLVSPRISHGLIASIFNQMNQHPEKAEKYAKLLSIFVLPLCSIDPPKEAISCEIGSTIKVFCPDTEEFFIESLTQVNSNIYLGQPKISVYHDEKGKPVALRKSSIESSALLLKDAVVDNLHIPKGTFVSICENNSATKSGEKSVSDNYADWVYESYNIGSGFRIAPGRLSPWAHKSPTDRELFGVQKYSNVTLFDKTRSEQCSKYNLGSFRKISSKILSEIGI